jgi:GDPmannose 4,6-dehydratase
LRSLLLFPAAAFAAYRLDWQDHVISVPELLRPTDDTYSIGRAMRAEERLGWTAKTRIPDVVHRLVAKEIGDRSALEWAKY